MGAEQATFLSAYVMRNENNEINVGEGKILELEGVKNSDLERIIIESRTAEELRERLAGVGINERTDDGHIIIRDIGDTGTKIFTKVGSITTHGRLDESIKAEIEAITDIDVTSINKIIEILESHGFKRDSLEIQVELDGRIVDRESVSQDPLAPGAQEAVRSQEDTIEAQRSTAVLEGGEKELSQRDRLEQQTALGRRDRNGNYIGEDKGNGPEI